MNEDLAIAIWTSAVFVWIGIRIRRGHYNESMKFVVLWFEENVLPWQKVFSKEGKNFVIILDAGWLPFIRKSGVTAYLVSHFGAYREFPIDLMPEILDCDDYEEAVFALNAAGAFR